MKNTFTSFILTLVLLVSPFLMNQLDACHLSSLELDNVTHLGGNNYQIDLTFCAEGGEGQTSITQPTRTFAFILDGAIITSFPSNLISPQTGANYGGYFHNNQPDTLIYLDPGVDWTCTSGCGSSQAYCKSFTLYTDGLPNSIFFIGAEGAGNPYGGCLGSDMYVYPGGNPPDPCVTFPIEVEAGSNETVYYGWGPEECAYLCASTSGSPSYPLTYNWSNGITSQSQTVCPTSNTTYTVTVTDNNGCTATDELDVNVIDVRCGKKNNKVLLCKPNGTTTVCIKYNKVQQKLNQGFTLGPCSNNIYKNVEINSRSLLNEDDFMAYPTIFSEQLTVKLNLGEVESVQLDMYDIMGSLVKNIYRGTLGEQTIEVNTQDLAAQTYFLRVILDSGEVSTLKVVKQH